MDQGRGLRSLGGNDEVDIGRGRVLGGVVVDVAERDSGASTRGLERITLGSPPGNERDEVGRGEWDDEEEGEDDEDGVHREDLWMFCELGNDSWSLEGFIGSMGGLARCSHRRI